MGARRRRLSAALALIFFAAALGTGAMGLIHKDGQEENTTKSLRREEWDLERALLARRRLSGPGSSPPTCRARCGRCFPCRPVHVAIQPGRSTLMEYYPEAWRCKCGNKLFMP